MLIMLPEKIAIIPLPDPDKTGSLYIPEQAKQKVDQGIVKYRGKDVKDILVGDHVFFNGYTGDWIATPDDGELVITNYKFILGKINKEQAEPLFPRSKVLSFIEECYSELRRAKTIVDGQYTVERYKELLQTKINDTFFADGLKF